MDIIIYKITCNENNKVYINATNYDNIKTPIIKLIKNYKSWIRTKNNYRKIFDFIKLNKVYTVEILEKCYNINNIVKNLKKIFWINEYKNNCINHLINTRDINYKKNIEYDNNVNYNNGKIYKLICNITNYIYIGSTTCDLNKRLLNHINKYNCWFIDNNKSYITSYKILENNNYEIELIEDYPCESKRDLEKRERYWLEYYINDGYNCVNKIIPVKTNKEKKETKKQYRENNKEQILKTKKIYRENNKEQLLEKQKIYRQNDDVKKQRAQYNKEYREKHHEHILNINKEYYQNNKEKILEQMKEKYKTKEQQYCDICKIYINRLNVHVKSKKHIDNVNKNITNDDDKMEYIEKKIKEKYCDVCKKSYNIVNFARHIKSDKHKNNL